MTEKVPVPISRGAELQKANIEALRQEAMDSYKRLTTLSRNVEHQIDAALALPDNPDALDTLTKLFAQKQALDDLAHDLEDVLLRALEHASDAQERWLALEGRLQSFLG